MKRYFLLLLLFSTIAFSQQLEKVDFKSVQAHLSLNPQNKSITGKLIYDFEVKSSIDTIKIDAHQMEFTALKINNKEVSFKNTGKQLHLFEGFTLGTNTLSFDYLATPKQTLYFIGSFASLESHPQGKQIWTQGQGKNTSHWFPSFDDMNEKVIFNLNITFDAAYQVISNGVLGEKEVGNHEITWHYQMKNPMSSYLLMLAIGKWEVHKQFSASGIPLYLYIEKEDEAKFESTYRYTKEIVDFFEKEIGVSYPWEVYKQIPVRDFLYAGMENTSATLFSRDFVVDAIGFNDKNYVNVNAHELAHQWFGDLITAESGKHHWLQEGFATYYALLAEKKVFGADYFYHQLHKSAQQLQKAAAHDTIPILNEKASSLTYYQKGAWALHVLREGLGEKIFQKAVRNYLKKHAFQNVNTQDFFDEIRKLSQYDLEKFSSQCLEQSGFDIEQANELLSKNKSMKILLALEKSRGESFNQKKAFFEKTMASKAFDPIKEEIVFQLENVPFNEKQPLLQLAMKTNRIAIRQAIAKTMPIIPTAFKSEYETLFDDQSYITREIFLNTYWSQFPEEQVKLLDKTSHWVGFNDKNLRILWLTLALGTKSYEVDKKVAFYDELLDYCSPKYESFVRQNAIESLLFINKNDQNVLGYLVNATTNHKWQFVKFARDKIRLLLKNKSHRIYFEALLPKLSASEQFQLKRLLDVK
jgi:aminopeptidase N